MVVATAVRGVGETGFRDLVSLLHPSAGLVASHAFEAPSAATTGTWRVTIRLACAHDEETEGTRPCVTGAAAPTRSEALLRALGESVERIALHPLPGQPIAARDIPDRAFPGSTPGLSLSALDPTSPTRWYPARVVRSDREVLVPSGLVDYPGSGPQPGFDPGPSGCAAGFGYDAALRSALLETIERDAVLVSWARQLTMRQVDLATLTPGPATTEVAALLRLGEEAGLSPLVGEVPTSVPGVRCVVGGFRDVTSVGPAICVGAKAGEDLSTCVKGAFSESLQLRQHLVATRVDRAGLEPPTAISGDDDRLAFLASDRGVDALERWFADPEPPAGPTSGQRLTADDLLRRAMGDGLDPLVLDLTDRLPDAARAMGWAVVKVVPAGYQPLRVDERTTFGWNLDRLHSAPRRTGATARRRVADRGLTPHPLP